LVILLGRKDSGKGTTAKILREQLGANNMVEIALAAHLKKSLSVLFDWPLELLEGATPESREWREKKDPVWSERLGMDIIPRAMMVRFGTRMVRSFISPQFWTAYLDNIIEKTPEPVIVIPDGRLIEEYEFFTNRYKNVIVFSVESDRAIAPYRDDLKKFIDAEVKALSPIFGPTYLVRKEIVEAYLANNKVFDDEAEISEWETVLLQLTDMAYIPCQHFIKSSNNSTIEDFANSQPIKNLVSLIRLLATDTLIPH